MSLLFELLAFAALFSGGVFLLALAVRLILLRRRMASWPRATGTVRAGSIYSRRRHHRPRFVVEYVFEGTPFTAECDSPTRSGFTDSRAARLKLERYPVGSQVRLFVDPAAPSHAFLWLPELSIFVFFLLGAAVLLTVALVGGASLLGLGTNS